MSGKPPGSDEEVLAAVRGALTAVRDSLDGVRMTRPAGELVAAGRARRRRALAVRAAVACGAAAAVTAATVVTITAGAGEAQARMAAYVTMRVEKALASDNLVFVGRSGGGASGRDVTWAYGRRYRYEEYWPTADHRDRIVNGQRLWDFPPSQLGQPYLAEGTALIGGKLTSAYVTYFDRRFSLSPLGSPPASACSTTASLEMASPITATHWPGFISATLACGAASVTGHVRVNGAETTRITGKPVIVRLSPGYGKLVREQRVLVSWTLYVNPATYLPVRISGSTRAFGGGAGNQVSWSVTDVQWLPPTPANIALTLVTIPAGFRQDLGPPGDQ